MWKINIKLIVGLANPGTRYSLTRHNAGAWYVESLAKCYNQFFKEEKRFFGYTTQINLVKKNIFLLIPTTYMNLSGASVLAVSTFYHIKPTEILVAHDELDLMPGTVKIKFGGNKIRHNGIKDIQNKLGNKTNFYRLRIGIGQSNYKNKIVEFVLSKPTSKEKKLINESIDEAVRCTPILIDEGITKAVNRLHSFKAKTNE